MLVPYTKDGKTIQGTLERLAGVALVLGKDEDGELIYEGSTTVWWDEQQTVANGDGVKLWVDEDGDELLESEIVWKEESE